MWCTSCALAVEGALARVPGVAQASVHSLPQRYG
ncbi:heavy-metal-associated domain-containing protein [Vreelandella lionensis]